jgi:ankyrin repeat protein
MMAAWNNPNPDVAMVLLDARANVNEGSSEGMTPLMYAAQFSGNPQVISTLLRAGANTHMRSSKGKTAFHYAQENAALKGSPQYKELEPRPYF